MEPNGSGFSGQNWKCRFSRSKNTTQEIKHKSSIQCLLILRSWFTKDWKTLEIPNESLENNPILNPLAAPSTKHNIVWRYRNSWANAILHRPCWQVPMLLPKMLSSRQKVLRNSEPIFPYGLFELGILSSRRDLLRWTCMGVPFCRKHSSPGFDIIIHGSWRPISYLL